MACPPFQKMSSLITFLFHINPVNFKIFAVFFWVFDAVLCTLVIQKVPCEFFVFVFEKICHQLDCFSEWFILLIKKVTFADTEIDWSTYIQQVSCYEQGIRNYSKIEGDTGPVVLVNFWFISIFCFSLSNFTFSM